VIRKRPLLQLFDYIFRDKKGRIVIAQIPNVPITIAGIAWGLEWFVRPVYDMRLDALFYAGLLVWAGWEIGWGVNPFRRVLGLSVFVCTVHTLSGLFGH